ncbi:MAG: DM13 domain-containing protein [Patescibacteria group bacterium]
MKKYILYTVGSIIGVAVLAFAYYAISPLFRTIKADDAIPDASPGVSTPTPPESFSIIDTPLHPASGTVRIVHADNKSYIRYENFKTINGPDIFVYLAKDLGAKEYVNIGAVKATEGNVNYEIPEGVNVDEYRYVMVWCKAFGVLFNYADLSQPRPE